MEANHTDLLIIGAGPAGCAVAKEASGMNILMVDSNVFPREKPCSGLLVEESQEILHNWRIPKNVFGKPAELDLRYIDIDNNLNVLQRRTLGNTDRKKLDTWLLTKIDNDIEILDNTTVSKIETGNPAKVTVINNGKERVITAKNVVGADGATSTVRRLLGFKPAFRYRTTQHFIKTDTKINDCQFIYWNKFTDWYLWILPKEDKIIEVGGTFAKHSDNSNALDILARRAGVKGEIIQKRNWLLSQPKTREEISLGNQKNIFLVGEAAGLISPSTGEGISFGLRSGITMGRALATEQPFTEYEKKIQPLISEVMEKASKAKAFADPRLRAKILNRELLTLS